MGIVILNTFNLPYIASVFLASKYKAEVYTKHESDSTVYHKLGSKCESNKYAFNTHARSQYFHNCSC